jgi:hypothetical protein
VRDGGLGGRGGAGVAGGQIKKQTNEEVTRMPLVKVNVVEDVRSGQWGIGGQVITTEVVRQMMGDKATP